MFGPDGYLPSGRWTLSPDELFDQFVSAFPTSTSRPRLFESWLHHRLELTELVQVKSQWIGGSFATTCLDPPDIDVVTFFDGPSFDSSTPARQRLADRLFRGAEVRADRNIDAYGVALYPEGHPAWVNYLVFRGYWDEYFSRLKHDNESPRGYLEVRNDSN